MISRADHAISEAVAAWTGAFPQVRVTRFLSSRPAAEAILHESADVGLIVVGAHGSVPASDPVARRCVAAMPCPVAIVPHYLTVVERERLLGCAGRLSRHRCTEMAATGIAALRHYQVAWLRPDVLAGVTVAAYLVPQVMAYAEVAGLPPVVGLWAISAALARLRRPRVVAAAVGGARVDHRADDRRDVAPLAAGDPARYAALAAALALLVGGLCLWPGWPGWASSPTCCPSPCWSATWPGSPCS